MKISFDLDDTLICLGPNSPHEARLPWYKRMFINDEPLRSGSKELFSKLSARGWEIWIYTTSNRDPGAIRGWLRQHGIDISGVINQKIHNSHLKRNPDDYPPSKHPKAFGIDLHVDDSLGVQIEGKKYGFDVVVISSTDKNWAEKVWLAAESKLGV